MYKIFFILIIFFSFSGCSPDDFSKEGIIWEEYLDSAIKIGLYYYDNTIYLVDNNNKIYALWKDLGSYKWNPRRFTNEIITTIIPNKDGLYVISYNTNSLSNDSTLRIFSHYDGIITYTTNLKIIPKKDFITNGNDIIIYSEDTICKINIDFKTFTYYFLSNYVKNIDCLIEGKRNFSGYENYYIFETNCNIIELDSTFQYKRKFSSQDNSQFNKSAIYFKNKIYYTTKNGINIFNTESWTKENSYFNWNLSYSPIILDELNEYIYIGLSHSGRYGVGKYDVKNNLNEIWFYSSYNPISYSPIVFANSKSLLCFLDDAGYLSIINLTNRNLLFEKYIGILNVQGIKFFMDNYENNVFIATSSPAQIICYSFEYIINLTKTNK